MLPEHVMASITRWFEKDESATFYERIELQEEGAKKFKDEGYSERYAHILEHILKGITVVINPGENIVGAVKEIIPDSGQREYAENLSVSWWDGISEEEKQRRIHFYYSPGWIKRRNPVFFSLGHLAFDWEAIISRGLGWFTDQALKLKESGRYDQDSKKTGFLSGAVEAYRAQSRFIERYGAEARILASRAENRQDRERLERIAGICGKISTGPAETFQEALQLIWFIALISQKVAGCGVFCFDRMDQYLLPLFEKDLAEGRLNEESAYGLLVEFFNKNNEIMDPADHMSQEAQSTKNNLEVTYDDPNYITIGGLLKPGKSGVNRLSFLFIQAAREMGLRNPFIVVRWHEGINASFWREVSAAMRDNATVVVYNDETMIPALLEYGVDPEDVYGYGFYGCNDPLIPAKEGALRQLWFNLVWPLELALNRGKPFCCPEVRAEKNFQLKDRLIGLMTGPYAGEVPMDEKEFLSMEEFIREYKHQVSFLLLQYLKLMEEDYRVEKENNAGKIRFEDLFLKGTIENAENWITGGVKYHKITVQGSGLATAVDSLAAVNRAVFTDKKYTLAQIRQALAEDFHGNEEMRFYLENLPKYGNDMEEVDRYARVVVDAFCDAVKEMNAHRTGLYAYMPTLSTDRAFTEMGEALAATADGRPAGEPIGENQSPAVGADENGATALLNSVSRIPFSRITGGPLNLTLHPGTVEGEQGLAKLASLLGVYMRRGGMQIQLNVVGKEELLDAQKNPGRYKNLCVRVTGYSAYFVQMGKIVQEELINRTTN